MINETRWDATLPSAPLPGRELFRERPGETARRVALGLAWRLRPRRIQELPDILWLHFREALLPSRELPDPEVTLRYASDVAGIAHDLSVTTLVAAHARGLQPFSHVFAPKWMSLAERCLLFYPDFKISKTQRAHIRKGRHRVTFDRAFERVVKACAQPRGNGLNPTWLTPRMMRAYSDMHDAGYAHSFEVLNPEGELVGGGFGVAIGRYYILKSMFNWEDNSSKVGLTFVNWHLAHWGYAFTDLGSQAPYKFTLGCRLVPRSEFVPLVAEACDAPKMRGRWDVQADAQTVAAWKPAAGRP